MFEVNKTYANRKGKYTVLSINGPQMKVRYQDGTETALNVSIQERIWENILAEQEAQRPSRRQSSIPGRQINFMIKTVNVSDDNLSIPGLQQRIAAAPLEVNLQPDDRLVYYAVEAGVFFAVATITGRPREAQAKEYMFGSDEEALIWLYPVDPDAHITEVKSAVTLDSVELESLPNYRSRLRQPNIFLPINEDDFELLSELITEIHEEVDIEDELDEELLEEDDDE